MSEFNGYRWEPSTPQRAPSGLPSQAPGGISGGDGAESSYRWEKSEAEKRQAEADEIRRKIADLDRRISELRMAKAENEFAASMVGEGDYSHFTNLVNSRRQARTAADAKAENDRLAWTAERENAQAALDEYLKQYRELYANFRLLPTEEQSRARISGEYLKKKSETLAKKYGLELPDMDGIANPAGDGVTLESLLYGVQKKAEAGELTEADVKAFEEAVRGMNGSFASYEAAKKKVGEYETKEKRTEREGKERAAKARERLRQSIVAKYKRAELAGDDDGMDAAIVEWEKNGFKGAIQ